MKRHGDIGTAEVPRRQQMRQAFDRLAPAYRQAAQVQSEIGLRLLSRLDLVKITPGVILDAGAAVGDGSLQLARRYGGGRVVVLDLSWRLLRERPRATGLKRWLGGAEATALLPLCGDFAHLPLADACIDLAVSNLALNWAVDPAAALRELHRVLKPGGLLMLSMLGPDTLLEWRSQRGGREPERHLPDMHDVGDLLGATGFSGPVMDQEHITLTYSSAASFRRDLRYWGAAAFGARGVADRITLRRLRTPPTRVTLEVVYGHAWKPTLRPRSERLPDGAAVIRFDRSLRR